jgi:Ni2+-binding GTPase involved in maturation of urease and hydrogenase
MSSPKLILVGGFLGAGKTTLLARAAERLSLRGVRVGLITNDQAANLVDTELLKQAGREVREVSGACFCCAFNKLLYACDKLVAEWRPDVLIGEPVGSCTDLSATVLQPLKKYCSDRFDLAPYSVLTDPARLREDFGDDDDSDLPQAVRYIYRKQLQEADLIVLNKIDTLAAEEVQELKALAAREFPGIPLWTMSALRGDAVDDWLADVLSGGPAGRRIAEVDYDTYAEGEAVLGWLNAAVELRSNSPAPWRPLCLSLLEHVRARCRAASAEIAHLKLLVETPQGKIAANLTSSGGEPSVRGDLDLVSADASLIVNARVRIGPEELKAIVEESLRQAAAASGTTATVTDLSCFSPARPKPVHRFGDVV